jgi:hypothetical protein
LGLDGEVWLYNLPMYYECLIFCIVFLDERNELETLIDSMTADSETEVDMSSRGIKRKANNLT